MIIIKHKTNIEWYGENTDHKTKVVNNKDVKVEFEGFGNDVIWDPGKEEYAQLYDGGKTVTSKHSDGTWQFNIGIGTFLQNSLIKENVKSSKASTFWHEIGHTIAWPKFKNNNAPHQQWVVGFENISRSFLNLLQRSGLSHGKELNSKKGEIVPGTNGANNNVNDFQDVPFIDGVDDVPLINDKS